MITTFQNSHTIETWYDRKSRNWITQHKDSNRNQIGNASFSGNKQLANITHKETSIIVQSEFE